MKAAGLTVSGPYVAKPEDVVAPLAPMRSSRQYPAAGPVVARGR